MLKIILLSWPSLDVLVVAVIVVVAGVVVVGFAVVVGGGCCWCCCFLCVYIVAIDMVLSIVVVSVMDSLIVTVTTLNIVAVFVIVGNVLISLHYCCCRYDTKKLREKNVIHATLAHCFSIQNQSILAGSCLVCPMHLDLHGDRLP